MALHMLSATSRRQTRTAPRPAVSATTRRSRPSTTT